MRILILFLILLSINSCRKSDKTIRQQNLVIVPQGEQTFIKYCASCHGKKGNLGMVGATNLQRSVLDTSEIIKIIREGKNNMPALKDKIPGTEIENVAVYTFNFRKINNAE